MLLITDPAIEAIRALGGPEHRGVRISPAVADGGGRGLALEAADAPDIQDEVIEAARVTLYIHQDALDLLDGKVLDALEEDGAVRFCVRG